MMRSWFQLILGLGIVASVLAFLFTQSPSPVAAQVPETATPPVSGSSPVVTNSYKEPVNVRSGPSSLYALLGTLAIGETAPALGVSPKHEWIQIEFPSSPDGVGWVYASFVTLSPGFLRVIEPPATITPLATATIDPTLATAFSVQPTETRLPTFTPPPPLTIPTFTNSPVTTSGFPWGISIIVIAISGVIALVVSLFIRR